MSTIRSVATTFLMTLLCAGCGSEPSGAVDPPATASPASAGAGGEPTPPSEAVQAANHATPGAGGAAGSAPSSDSEPPAATTESRRCILSADCPAGQHCDLGECIQSCNVEQPCTGGLHCSARGRCLAEGAPDADPEPIAEHVGSVQVDPIGVVLTDEDDSLALTLSTSSTEPVRYRVQLDAPHLRLDQERGEFTGQTTLQLAVDSSSLPAAMLPGTVRIFTRLGELTVSAPIQVGLSGTYQGALQYDGGLVQLGATKLALDLLEGNGEVWVRVDPNSSLLFPRSVAGDVTGQGTYSRGEGLRVVINQRFEAGFGGERNHFGRPIGRRLTLVLRRQARGRLEGTFDETLYGLFTTPIRLGGSVMLERRPSSQPPDFTLGAVPAMPTAPEASALLQPQEVFGWDTSCEQTLELTDPGIPHAARNACVSQQTSTAGFLACVSALEEAYYENLVSTLQLTPPDGAQPLQEPAAACEAALAADSFASYHADERASACALQPVLACALSQTLLHPSADLAVGQTFTRLVARTAAPALLVAGEHVVQGLYESFSRGLTAERRRYDQAVQTLGPVARWLYQPGILQFARQLTTHAAQGDGGDAASPGPDSDPTRSDFPAGRTLARLSYLLSHIDGERARLAVAAGGDLADATVTAQERGILTYLEAAATSEILASWGSPPPALAASLTGVLTPLDRGFAALCQGAAAFGYPEWFVPFVYRDSDASGQSTNFEQMLAIASQAIGTEQRSEEAFVGNLRAYEQNQAELQAQLTEVRASYDQQLASLCGEAFDPDSVNSPDDWNQCAADGSGEIASLQLDIEAAQQRMRDSYQRLEGMDAKIEIDRQALAQTQGVHAETLRFIRSSGEELEQIIWTESIIHAAQAALSTAANASITNFGAPAGMAVLAGAFEMDLGALQVARNRIQTAQQLRFEQAQAQIELINGMANIQRQLIDLAQLEAEIEIDCLGVLQTELRLSNALQQGHRVHEERARVLQLIVASPAHDPTFRLLRDQRALSLLSQRTHAQTMLYLAGKALEYEINQSLENLLGAVLAATNGQKLRDLEACLGSNLFAPYRIAFGSPQPYETVISVRELLGIRGERHDEVTGETLSEAEQFRRILLQNQNLDARGGVGVTFSTNLQPGNPLWVGDVCADKITSIEAQVVGDFLGDNEAWVNVQLEGASFLRSCSTEQVSIWNVHHDGQLSPPNQASIQAGVNDFLQAQPNNTLFGRSVAHATWRVILPGAMDAPANRDLDLNHIEDIVLRVSHGALPRNPSAGAINTNCLAAIVTE